LKDNYIKQEGNPTVPEWLNPTYPFCLHSGDAQISMAKIYWAISQNYRYDQVTKKLERQLFQGQAQWIVFVLRFADLEITYLFLK